MTMGTIAMWQERVISKKGSYILEAAIVLPVIMLTVITSVLIIMFFYTQMTEQCRLHEELRKEAETATGKEVYDKRYLIMEDKGLLHKKGTFVVEGKSHVVDGPSYIRYSSIIRDKNNE